MGTFSTQSLAILGNADPRLQTLFKEVVKTFDCTVICSYRDKESQTRAFMGGNSSVDWPDSKHNTKPSLAVDVAPYYPGGIRWTDNEGMYYFAGYVKATAERLGIKVRGGADWDMDCDTQDQKLHDPNHFEVVD